MIRVFSGFNLSKTRMLTLAKWAKRNAAYGAYIEVNEVVTIGGDLFDVFLYQERTRVDKKGNRYVVSD